MKLSMMENKREHSRCYKHPDAWLILSRRINMNNKINQLQIDLHTQAGNAPIYDPFTIAGNQAWSEWAESCRELERQLEAEGVSL